MDESHDYRVELECWIQTRSGVRINPLKPELDQINIQDIGHALSNLCRFAGHTSRFYSVAQHSVLVSQNVPPGYELEGLLHDAAEAYLLDIPRPLKPHITNFREIEERLHACIANVFGIPATISRAVKRVDDAILYDEASQLIGDTAGWWFYEPPLGIEIIPLSPEVAHILFFQRYQELVPHG